MDETSSGGSRGRFTLKASSAAISTQQPPELAAWQSTLRFFLGPYSVHWMVKLWKAPGSSSQGPAFRTKCKVGPLCAGVCSISFCKAMSRTMRCQRMRLLPTIREESFQMSVHLHMVQLTRAIALRICWCSRRSAGSGRRCLRRPERQDLKWKLITTVMVIAYGYLRLESCGPNLAELGKADRNLEYQRSHIRTAWVAQNLTYSS